MKLPARILFFPSLLLVSACAMGKDYQLPTYDGIDNAWNALMNSEQDASRFTQPSTYRLTGPWWERFGDKQLDTLVKDALANNNDVQQAQARVDESRANEALAASGLFPQVSATGSVQRQTVGGFEGDRLDSTKRYGLQGNWDLDVFGGNRRRTEAAAYNTQAAEALLAQTRLQVVTEVARNYVRLRSAQQQYALVEKNLRLQRDTLKITQGLRDEKMVSELDVMRSRAQTNNTKARLPQVRAELSAAFNRLAVLTATSPKALQRKLKERAAIPVVPKHIVIATPLETIAYRPDVRAAERQLAESTALTAAAFTEFFPKISLEGFFGRSNSNTFGSLSPWNAAASGLLPLLNFGKIQAGVDAANARQQQAYHNFRQTVLLAVEDVEVNFSGYLNELERAESLRIAAGEQARAVEVAREQYIAGIGQQLDLLDAEQNLLIAENELVISEGLAAQNAVRLYGALGRAEPSNLP